MRLVEEVLRASGTQLHTGVQRAASSDIIQKFSVSCYLTPSHFVATVLCLIRSYYASLCLCLCLAPINLSHTVLPPNMAQQPWLPPTLCLYRPLHHI